MVAGLKIAGLILQHESCCNKNLNESSGLSLENHHGHTEAFEKRFQLNVDALLQEFITEGNPFEEETDILYTLVIKVMMSEEVKT